MQQKKDDDDDDETVERLIVNRRNGSKISSSNNNEPSNNSSSNNNNHVSVDALGADTPTSAATIDTNHNANGNSSNHLSSQFSKIKRKSTHSARVPPTEKKLTLTWENLNVYKPKSKFYYLKTKLGQTAYQEDKHIVKNVSGLARPYEILAILGASGCGKTTLLNALNLRNRGELNVRGEIRVNGRLINMVEEISAVSGYVQQNDLFIGTLRVGEHLTFQAMLRMDPHLTQQERRTRVQEVLKYFNLRKCEDSLIGCPEFGIKGISGGERRRLSFASEILTNPSILFCDEPTSGLDSFMALSIIESMKRLAKNGKTIIFTIHQPSSDLFEKFDRVCFVSEGRIAFLGDRTQAHEFFDSQNFRCPSNYNPAEFYIKTLSISPFAKDVCQNQVNAIADSFESSSFNESVKSEINRVISHSDENGVNKLSSKDFTLYRTSVFTQFFWLMWRNIVAIKRDTASTRILLIQSVAIGIMYGLIFFRIENNQEGIMNVNALIFLSVIYACVIYLFTECKTFPVEIQIFLREHQNGMYKVISYYMSKSLIELPIHIICPFVFVSIFYWMAGLSDDPYKYLLYVFVIVLASQTSVSFGHFLSAISPTVTVASGLAGPILGPLMIFSGHLLNNSSTPTYFLWLKYLSWLSYANEAILMTHWKGVENIKCSEYSPRCLSTGEHVLNHLHVDDEEFAYTIYMQILLIIGWRTLAILVLLVKSYSN